MNRALPPRDGHTPRVAGDRGLLRRVWSRITSFVLAAVIFLGMITAGRSYLWCSMMERAVEACCCEPEQVRGDVEPDERAALKAGCCEHRASGEIAQARIGAEGVELPAMMPAEPVCSVAPLVHGTQPAPIMAASPRPAGRLGSIRAGPRTASDFCVRLQVFRC